MNTTRTRLISNRKRKKLKQKFILKTKPLDEDENENIIECVTQIDLLTHTYTTNQK